MSTIDWFMFLLSTAIALALFIIQFRHDIKKTNDKIEKLAALIEKFVPFLEKKMALDNYEPIDRTEGQLLHYIDSSYKETRKYFIEDKLVTLFEFNEVWRLLLREFFEGRSEGILRDVTFSSHGDTSFQMYDFSKYPSLIKEYVDKYQFKQNKVRFMMICSPGNDKEGVNNRLAEEFLRLLLKIKYPRITETEKLLTKWAEDANDDQDAAVSIMVTNESLVRKVAGLASFECPFNVYGDLAVSRSIVKGKELERKLPHIEVSTKPEDIENSSRLFDSVWNESRQFRAKMLLGLSVEQKKDFGNGEAFALWSAGHT